LIIHDLEAKEELRNMLVHQKFGAASTKVIEEFLDGIELSCFVLTDGKSYKYFQQRKITNALAKATLD
jgi:phosphoribosylamine--glycine ligase